MRRNGLDASDGLVEELSVLDAIVSAVVWVIFGMVLFVAFSAVMALALAAGMRACSEESTSPAAATAAAPDAPAVPASPAAAPENDATSEAAGSSAETLTMWRSVAPSPSALRRRLGVIDTNGERVPVFESERFARGAAMRGMVLLYGKLTDLAQLRETWVVAPKHWMN